MRLLHPKTLQIASSREDIPKTVISHVWSEIFKWKASGKSHPKMFLKESYYLGIYLRYVYGLATRKGCNLDKSLVNKHFGKNVVDGFKKVQDKGDIDFNAFDDNYLFSDACSLYYKGINIFPDLFGDDWRKYVPVESHKEIIRQCNKTLIK